MYKTLDPDIKESQSYKNIYATFTKETDTIIRYIIYAYQARKENREEIAQLFDSMRDDEIEHIIALYKSLHGSFRDWDIILQELASEKKQEWKEFYPKYEKVAKEEGHNTIAEMFLRMISIKNAHNKQCTEAYLNFVNNVHDNEENISHISSEISSSQNTQTLCTLCGYTADKELVVCPICDSSEYLAIL